MSCSTTSLLEACSKSVAPTAPGWACTTDGAPCSASKMSRKRITLLQNSTQKQETKACWCAFQVGRSKSQTQQAASSEHINFPFTLAALIFRAKSYASIKMCTTYHGRCFNNGHAKRVICARVHVHTGAAEDLGCEFLKQATKQRMSKSTILLCIKHGAWCSFNIKV